MIKNLKLEIERLFPKNVPIIFFHAHGDDEAFLSAGLINQLVKINRKCIIIYAAAAVVNDHSITSVRQVEIKNACDNLGVKQVYYLPFSEPQYLNPAKPLIRQNVDHVIELLNNLLIENSIEVPFVLVSYDKNGGYGNVDHKVVHTIGRVFATKYKVKLFSLIEVTINRNRIKNWLDGAKKRLDINSIPQLSYWASEFGLIENEITHSFVLSKKQLLVKRRTLAIHKSQVHSDIFPLSLTSKDFSKVFGTEYYTYIVNES